MPIKIAFICGWPFGTRGTPGTFRLVQRLSERFDSLIFSPIASTESIHDGVSTKMIPLASPPVDQKRIEEVGPILSAYKPDIIYLFNFPTWPQVAEVVDRLAPNAKMLLDVKTPLLVTGQKRAEIQQAGLKAQRKLDAILALSKESVATWIPNLQVDVIEYPLGIERSLFEPLGEVTNAHPADRFVFVSTLHPKRKCGDLVRGFESFVRTHHSQATLDIFGSGPDFDAIEHLIEELGMRKSIRMRGLKLQADLMKELKNFDAGIGWVPREYYDDSPSLKVLEYAASGLAIAATRTMAHEAMLREGFSLSLFDENAEDLSRTLQSMSTHAPDPADLRRNQLLAFGRDYNHIIEGHLLPVFDQLLHPIGQEAKWSNQSSGREPSISEVKPRCSNKDSLSQPIPSTSSNRGTKKNFFILIATLALGKGGAERVAAEMANEMSRRGHSVYVGYEDKGSPAYAVDPGVVLVPYNSLSKLSALVRRLNPDVYFVFYFNEKLIDYYRVVHGTSIPFGMQECTNPARLCDRNWKSIRTHRVASRWEREIIAAAASRIRLTMPGYANSFAPFIRPSIRCFPNPAFPQSIDATHYDRKSDQYSVIVVNGFKANKNLYTMLEAFAPLAREFPNWTIKVVGKSPEGGQPHKKRILELIEQQSLTDRIDIIAPSDHMEAHYSSSDIHVIASLSEGCPTVVLEAMAAGIPSIGFADCPGTNELIKHMQNGLLASGEDRVTALREQMRLLMGSPKLRQALGKCAAEDSKAFEPSAIYDQWEKLLLEASEYRSEPDRLRREQSSISAELALHAERMRQKLVEMRN